MKKLKQLLACSLVLSVVAAGAQAQAMYAPPPDAVPYPGQPYPPQAYPPPPYPQPYQGQPAAAPVAPAPIYAPQQLDQMLAPIALYPDPLLTQILTAATYPMELDQAAQWRAAPGNAQLAGPPLAETLQAYDWDPSVKSLVPFPQTLSMMDQHLDWTEAIGRAFLAQQGDVMDSVQRLRRDALNAGTLVSSPYASVMVNGPYISIEPAGPQMVYVPVYDPSVYGAWPNPGYPPIYYGPPPGLAPRYVVGGLGFAAGIVVVDVLWQWGHPDWQRRRVDIDANRFNRINVGRPPVREATWQHEPDRRDPHAPQRPLPQQHDASLAPAPAGQHNFDRRNTVTRPVAPLPQAATPHAPAPHAPAPTAALPPAAGPNTQGHVPGHDDRRPPQGQPQAQPQAQPHAPAPSANGHEQDRGRHGQDAALPRGGEPPHAPPQAPVPHPPAPPQAHVQAAAPPHPPAPPQAHVQAAAPPHPPTPQQAHVQAAAPPQPHPAPAPQAHAQPAPPHGEERPDEHHP